MDLKTYSEIIEKTAVYPKEFGCAYTILGLIEEIGELQQAAAEEILYDFSIPDEVKCSFTDSERVVQECGDVCWYTAATLAELDLDMTVLVDIVSSSNDPIFDLAKFGKKYIRDKNENLDLLLPALKKVMLDIQKALNTAGVNFEDCLQMNYDKLMKRRDDGTIHGDGDNR